MSERIVIRREADGSLNCSEEGVGEIKARIADGQPERRLELLNSACGLAMKGNLDGLVVERDRLTAGEVPVLMVYPEGARRLPVVFFVHGYTGAKECDLQHGANLARAGFFAVILDARLHGERRPADFDQRFSGDFPGNFLPVIHGTALDVSSLIDYFAEDGRIDPERVGMSGISMGGFTTFAAVTMDKRIKAAVPLIGSPYWGPPDNEKAGEYKPTEETLRFISTWEPLRHAERFWPTALLMQNGVDDRIVPISGARRLREKLQPLYASAPERLRLIEYPGVGHEVTPEMAREYVGWFKKYLCELPAPTRSQPPFLPPSSPKP